MPELPEVETIRRTLTGKVEGRIIARAEVRLPRLIKWPAADEFQVVLAGKKIESLTRRGKYLVFHLDNGYALVIHLRMTGRLFYVPGASEFDRFVHVIFHLDDGSSLIYADTRTLGTLYLMPEDELPRIAGLAAMGPEPLTPEFTADYLRDTLRRRSGKIKTVLLNQQLIGGLGNIYVDESLALAGIHPERPASSLTDTEIQRLHQSINKVIGAGIAHGGTSFRDYRDGANQKGSHQDHLLVYGRKAEPCKLCSAVIERTVVAGRGTHFCPKCQK
ncbi:MAG: DNA-formamidopyrimidine glycosylase [Negativicutes bacterium]|nr:DNA-formamidopyrimidine glycosylase [Negativicutes bacterium]